MFGDNFFKRVENKTNVDKNTIFHSNDAIIIMSARILLVDITIIRSPIEFIIGQ